MTASSEKKQGKKGERDNIRDRSYHITCINRDLSVVSACSYVGEDATPCFRSEEWVTEAMTDPSLLWNSEECSKDLFPVRILQDRDIARDPTPGLGKGGSL
jgi:hypothetical protein